MKRDLDLVRKILLDIEAPAAGSGHAGWARASGEGNGSEPEALHYHVQLLHDAGLIVADELVPGQWWPERITWEGHEFLDLARDDARWNEVTPARFEKPSGSAAPFRARPGAALRRNWRASACPRLSLPRPK